MPIATQVSGSSATVTGPLRIVSNGIGGTIAGRVTVDRARWALGRAAEDNNLPRIATREINGEGRGRAQVSGRDASWRYLVNASAPNRVAVEGLGRALFLFGHGRSPLPLNGAEEPPFPRRKKAPAKPANALSSR